MTEQLVKQLPADEDYQRATHLHLETKVIDVHVLAQKALRLRERYPTFRARRREYATVVRIVVQATGTGPTQPNGTKRIS